MEQDDDILLELEQKKKPEPIFYRCPINNFIHSRSVEIKYNPKRRFSHYVNNKYVKKIMEKDPTSFQKQTKTCVKKRGWYFHEKYLNDYINWLIKV